jgi:hypothetical protein
VRLWLPTAKDEVDSTACPDDRATVFNVVLPSLKTTDPVGVPAVDVTCAVKDSVCPKPAVLEDGVKVVEVVAVVTVWVKADEVELW